MAQSALDRKQSFNPNLYMKRTKDALDGICSQIEILRRRIKALQRLQVGKSDLETCNGPGRSASHSRRHCSTEIKNGGSERRQMRASENATVTQRGKCANEQMESTIRGSLWSELESKPPWQTTAHNVTSLLPGICFNDTQNSTKSI